jgi:hypothetical protein
MKKLFLLLAAGSIAMNVGAQELHRSMSTQTSVGDRHIDVAGMRAEMKNTYAQPNAAHKTTAGGSRWYLYAGAMDTSTSYLISMGGTISTANTVQTIWNDTNGTVNYTSGLAHNTMVSQSAIFEGKDIQP